MFKISVVALLCLVFPSLSSADEHEHHGHGHGHHHHVLVERVYYQPVPEYVSPPPPPPAHFNSYDQRSHQGLAGGVIGSVVGYELGSGNPIASGLGAAAGSYLGNRMAR